MTETDQRTLDELHTRAWGWTDLRHRKTWSLPSWAFELLVPRRRMGAYHAALGLFLGAHRAGAVGVYLSYAEAVGVFGCSSRTWGRWVREWERLGLVATTHTWRSRGDDGAGREYGRLLYRLGPAWKRRAGPGLLETAGSDPSARLAERCAMGLRKAAYTSRSERLAIELARQSRNSPRSTADTAVPAPEQARTQLLSSPPSPPGGDENPPPPPGVSVQTSAELAPLALVQQAPPADAPTPTTAAHHGHPRDTRPRAPQLEARSSRPKQHRPKGEARRSPAEADTAPAPDSPEAAARREARVRAVSEHRAELERFGVRFGAPPDLPTRRPRLRTAEGPPCAVCRGAGLLEFGRVCAACDGSGRGPS
jgi:hypothetical protein